MRPEPPTLPAPFAPPASGSASALLRSTLAWYESTKKALSSRASAVISEPRELYLRDGRKHPGLSERQGMCEVECSRQRQLDRLPHWTNTLISGVRGPAGRGAAGCLWFLKEMAHNVTTRPVRKGGALPVCP